MKIKKGDTVAVIAGKNRGKKGKVITVFPKEGRLTVEHVNMFKKHVRPKREGGKGETIQISRPLSASNVMLLCPACNKPTRVAHAVKNEEKLRACKKCKHAFA